MLNIFQKNKKKVVTILEIEADPLISPEKIVAFLKQDPQENTKLLEDAANRGNFPCQDFLYQGKLYFYSSMENKESVPQEVKEKLLNDAMHFMLLAAKNGDGVAQCNLGLNHMKKVRTADGQWGVDFINHIRQAYFWYGKSAYNETPHEQSRHALESYEEVKEVFSEYIEME